ncbi:MAG: NYN domain-containing protein [Candidatus Dormibacteria bacterium]
MSDNDNKVALFIDFDNIRIGIRQHFSGELHPAKLVNKASKYGRVVTAKAYADFTGHPKEFQDKLLFAAGIEPVHAPSKVSGGRRQSSADMHMVIDMLLEAFDHDDIDTFVLMTGDADFVRVVATLRNRFRRKVVISGVQSTSTSLGLMNAGDVRDAITKQDCDMTGEQGRMSRPLVTRADLDAQEAVAEAAKPTPQQAGLGGLFKGLFGSKRQQAPTAEPVRGNAAPTPIAMPLAAPAPRRLRASELRGGGTTAPSTGGGRAPRSEAPRSELTRTAAPAARRLPRPTAEASAEPRGQRGQRELAPVAPGAGPDELEQKMIREIFSMPPGRSGYTTIKTIEETLRSKAGQMGWTRKEVPTRLERLETMGLFKRDRRNRGTGEVETGELLLDDPRIGEITQGLTAQEPRPERPARTPRSRRPAIAAGEGSWDEGRQVSEAETGAPTPAEASQVEPAVAVEPAPVEDDDGTHFRWVNAPAASAEAAPADALESAEKPAPKPRRAPRRAVVKVAAEISGEAKPTPKPRASRARKKPEAATPDPGTLNP